MSIVVDARGSFCPGPLMELIAAIREAGPGDTIELLSTEDDSKRDVPIWVHNARHTLVGIEDLEGFTKLTVRVEL